MREADTGRVDDKERLTFLQSLADKVNKPASQDAYVYATVAVASVQLQLRDFPAARKKLDESEQVLDTFDTVETVVHAAFYRVNAEYYKVMLLPLLLDGVNKASRNTSLHRTTRTPFFSLPASTFRNCPARRRCSAPTT